MRYWWVNQNQTYRQEVRGGYLWSPKRKSNGHQNAFYDFMREVAPDDVIFSFADTLIKAIGIARSHAYESPKPMEFGNAGAYWDEIGWRVDVGFAELKHKVRPSEQMDVLRPLRSCSLDEVWRHIEQLRARGGPSERDDQPAPGDLKSAEWDLLSHPTTEREDGDFRARPTERPAGYEPLLHQVVLVSRLREVRAMLGFTRIQAPEGEEPRARVPLSRDAEQWVPAVEQRGEGVFLELNEDAVSEWEGQVADHERVRALEAAYRRWAAGRDAGPVPPIPTARYILLHTLSHLLIRQMALECGYSSASISERIYVGRPGAPAAGVLLSTAASDSEGTLGGLVALGRAKTLKRLLDGALDEAQRCSSDPLCADHLPVDPSQALHAAACHACLFASETTCESNNRWLDRKALVDLGGRFAFLT